MQRRRFLAASLAASAVAISRAQAPEATTSKTREYYQLRKYTAQSGPQNKLIENYFSDALVPALGKMGAGPIGAFKLDIGPETPSYYLLVPHTSIEQLTTLDLRLSRDEAFLKTAEPFWQAPATAPAFLRSESSLLAAFEGWPRITPPATAASKTKRILQLRTYESPSDQAHVRKVEMFHHGEFEIFQASGFHSVFFGDTLVGPRMPSLTYMLSFGDMTELNAKWEVFSANADWKKLSSSPRYNYESIVSNITNLILSPLSCSQV